MVRDLTVVRVRVAVKSIDTEAGPATLELLAQRTVADGLFADAPNVVADELLAGNRLQDLRQDRQAILRSRFRSVAVHARLDRSLTIPRF